MHAIKASAETERTQHGNTAWLENPLTMMSGSTTERLKRAMRRGALRDVETTVERVFAKVVAAMLAPPMMTTLYDGPWALFIDI